MPPLPPLQYVLEALYQRVLPGAGGAALVLAAFLLLGRWAAALGSAAAVVVAYAWGNFAVPILKTEDPVPTWNNTWGLLQWKPDETAPGSQWLPRAALVLVVVGLLSRWVGLVAARTLPVRSWWGANVLVWAPRAAAVFVVSAWLVLGKAAEAEGWAHLRWELVAAMLLLWIVCDSLARAGFSAEVSIYLGASLFAGSGVLLYTHNAKFMELAVVLGSAMFGIAVVTYLAKPSATDAKVYATGAIPAAVVFLPGLVLGTRPTYDKRMMPDLCFWLVALVPLLLAPFLIPRVSRQNRWLLLGLRVLLVLTPLAIAVALAGQHEKLPYEEETEAQE